MCGVDDIIGIVSSPSSSSSSSAWPLRTTDAIIVNGHGHEEQESSSIVEWGAMPLHSLFDRLDRTGLLNLEKLTNIRCRSLSSSQSLALSLLKSVCLIR